MYSSETPPSVFRLEIIIPASGSPAKHWVGQSCCCCLLLQDLVQPRTLRNPVLSHRVRLISLVPLVWE